MTTSLHDERVAVVHDGGLAYPLVAPFDPPNPVYDAVLGLLERLGLDAAQARTPAWNPLGALVGPGQHVVIKPNFVSSRNFHHRYAQDEFLCCCTHPSVIRPLIDLAWRALDGHGTISIAEAPLEGGQFENTLAALGVTAMVETLRARDGVPLELIDLRDFQIVPRMLLDDVAVAGRSLNVGALERRPLPGDPRGYRTVDLGAASSFAGLDGRCDGLRFHHSNPGLPSLHHRDGRHEYSFGKTVLAADLLISMPKMKSHKKTGVTLGLKNMIGTTNQKYWLPHFTAGAPPEGDEYPVTPPLGWRLQTFLSRMTLPGGHAAVVRFPPVDRREDPFVYDGNWSGNDTLWRTILDLNRILLHADKNGELREDRQRTLLTIIDGIVAGEGNGPLAPVPKRCGVLVGGLDPWACDWVTTRMMGVDPAAIGFLAEPARAGRYAVTRVRPEDVEVVPRELADLRFAFALPVGWRTAAATAGAPSR